MNSQQPVDAMHLDLLYSLPTTKLQDKNLQTVNRNLDNASVLVLSINIWCSCIPNMGGAWWAVCKKDIDSIPAEVLQWKRFAKHFHCITPTGSQYLSCRLLTRQLYWDHVMFGVKRFDTLESIHFCYCNSLIWQLPAIHSYDPQNTSRLFQTLYRQCIHISGGQSAARYWLSAGTLHRRTDPDSAGKLFKPAAPMMEEFSIWSSDMINSKFCFVIDQCEIRL